MAAIASSLVRKLRPKRNGTTSLPKLDPLEKEDVDSLVTPQEFAENFLKIQTEIQHLKNQISHQSKTNFKLDKDLRFFDARIALLINHKITVEELDTRVIDGDSSALLPGLLKDLQHPQLYGRLLFLLQATPEYIARLTRRVSLREIDGLLQVVMFTLYGNQYEDREEHLLLSMFEHALTFEVQEATEINSLMRANTAITRMMTTYCRRGPGQEFVKSSLGETIKNLVSYDGSMEIDPLKIYQELIDNEEVARPADSSKLFQEAEANPKVQKLIKEHIPVLQEYVLIVLKRLKEVIDEVPFGIRWLCKATRALVQEKFPEAEVETINAFVGGFFFLRYINPVIVTPHAYRLIQNPPPHQARRNLTLVVKVLQKLANTSSVREGYMMPLDSFVRSNKDELKSLLVDLCKVDDFHESLQLEEYIALCRKDLQIDIAVSEIALLHTQLVKYQKDLISSPDDPLSELLKELPEPNEESLKNKQSVVKLDLIPSRENIELPTFSPRGVSLDVSDEIATTWRQCKHLLLRLFGMAPHCLQESTLSGALTVALSSPLEDVVSNAKLTRDHIKTLTNLGGLNHQGRDLYEDIKACFPDKRALLEKAKLELKSLTSVYEAMLEHSDYLQEQLDAYKEYLTAVRTKVGQPGNNVFRRTRGTYRFSHQALEKEGVILETPGIPEQRRKAISYQMSCPEPGIYLISMYYKGHQKAIYEKTLHLEDLLELQHLRDPIIDMEGFVILNVRRTLLLLNRYFMRRDSGSHRPISRHFSAPALTLNGAKN